MLGGGLGGVMFGGGGGGGKPSRSNVVLSVVALTASSIILSKLVFSDESDVGVGSVVLFILWIILFLELLIPEFRLDSGLVSVVGNCEEGMGRPGITRLGTLPKEPTFVPLEEARGKGNEEFFLLTNQSGSCGAVLGLGGM
jgi:hypothetical protein